MPTHRASHIIKALHLDVVNESCKVYSYVFYFLQEGNEEWFVLGEDPAGVSPDIVSRHEEISGKGSIISDTKVEQEKEIVKQVSLIANYVKFCMFPELHTCICTCGSIHIGNRTTSSTIRD